MIPVYPKSYFDRISYGCTRYYSMYEDTSNSEMQLECDNFLNNNKNGYIILDDYTDI